MRDGIIKMQGEFSASGLAAIEILRTLGDGEISAVDYNAAKGSDRVPYNWDSVVANGLVRFVRKDVVPSKVVINGYGRHEYFRLDGTDHYVSGSDLDTLDRVFGMNYVAKNFKPKKAGYGHRIPAHETRVYVVDYDACDRYETVARAMVEVMRLVRETN